ncbi:haloacid dehalogenase type II [Candidatus Gottesmanbacteria bacterium]|nr:haloacid dehalogenase type II [Candidatus Gottesmanbacteria bacterium]
MKFKNKKFITFDCYGTLIDWEGGIRKAVKKLADKNGFNFKLDDTSNEYIKTELQVESEKYRKYYQVLQLSVKRLFKSKGFDISDQDTIEFAKSIYTWPPFQETKESLSKLKDRGYKHIILSNIDNDIIQKSVQLIGVDFDGIVTAEEVGSYKPAHGHWSEVLKRYETKKEEILHVAASYVHDIIPAKEQGFDAIWINRNNEQPISEIRADLELDNLLPLPDSLS